ILEYICEHSMISIVIVSSMALLQVDADIQPSHLLKGQGLAALLVRVASVYPFEDVVVGRLQPDLDPGGPQCQGLLDLGPQEAIGFRFHREPDASGPRRFVSILRFDERRGLGPIQAVETTFDERSAIGAVEGGEGPAQDDQVNLVGVMPDSPQRGQPRLRLSPRIVAMVSGAAARPRGG